MRRFFLTGLVAIGLTLGATIVHASTRSNVSVNVSVDDATRTYWREAQQLTQGQATLLDRVEQSTEKPEANRLKALSGQVLLHTSAVDRFLKFNYPDPVLLCLQPTELGEVAGTDSATKEQVAVYCSLYRSTHELTTLKTRIDLQAKLMNPNTQIAQPQPKTPINLAAVNVSNRQVLVLVQASRQRLAQMQTTFPAALRISIVQPVSTPNQSALRSR